METHRTCSNETSRFGAASPFLFKYLDMNFLEKILDGIGFARKEKANLPTLTGGGVTDPFTIWRTQKKIPSEKALEVYAGWVYACIRAIAEEIGNMEYRLFKAGKETDEELFEHDLLDLLDGVNENQTGLELKYMIATHLEAVGNAYLYLDGVADETSKPTAIYILNPAKVRVIVDRQTFPSRIEAYEYRLSAKNYRFEPYQILHIKYPDPSDPYEGIGTVQSIAQWIDQDNYATEFNRRFFLNGARLGGFLESESAYSPEQLDYLKKSFESIFKGVENAYKVAALPKGTKFTAASESQKDMDFANLSLMMRDKILAGFRVPRTALGITDDVNRANAEATNYVFALRTIKPKMQLIVSYLNEFLVPRYGENLYLDFVDPVPQNRELEIQEMTAASGAQPILSPNESRERYFGAPPIQGGDDVRGSAIIQPIGAPKGQSKAVSRLVAKTNGKQKPSTRFARNASKRKSIAEGIVAKALASLQTKAKEVKEKSIAALNDEEYEILWKGFVTRVAPYEQALIKKVRTLNADQKEEVLKNLVAAIKAAKGINEDALFDSEKWVGVLVDFSEPIMTDLMQQEGKTAGQLIGIEDIDVLTPEVRKALKNSLELMADSYNDTTRNLLKDKLEKGLEAGLSINELKDEVSTIYEFSDEIRAEQVARTETFRIANEATHAAWKHSSVVKTIKWYTAADERVCPYCEPLHGKVVGIDEDFFKKGDEVTGSDGTKLQLEYDDIGTPPLHVSCRCYIRPEEINIE